MAKFKSKASRHLKNNRAVREMLAGTHKTQTNRTYGYSVKKSKIREVGETWIETSPAGIETRWEQCDGFRIKTGANSVLDEINKILHMPEECPKCGTKMYGEETRLNKKFWTTQKSCFECVVKLETKLRAEGKFDEYSRKKLHANAESWFKDVDKEVEVIKVALDQKLQYVQNKDGDLEEYDQANYKKKYLKYIDEQYERFKKETLTNLKHGK